MLRAKGAEWSQPLLSSLYTPLRRVEPFEPEARMGRTLCDCSFQPGSDR
jgi:hypothetical protein